MHRLWPPDQPVPPCGPCKSLRLNAEAAEKPDFDAAAADLRTRVERRRAIDACALCDENGLRDLDDRLTRCAHPAIEAVS